MELLGEDRYRFWLYCTCKGNTKRFAEKISAYASAEEAFHACRASEDDIDKRLLALEKAEISVLPLGAPNYPALLSQIYDPPVMLFVRGQLRETPLPIAVIGARKCTDYGRRVTEMFVREIAEAGCCVISGLAYGIDALAARMALESKSDYPTVAVLGTGVDIAYPTPNAGLYAQIIERGAVISEYLPGTPPLKANFPKRNRIISGMARGVLVVEAAVRSGTSITVNYALDEGRDVFAVPGRITDAMSAGCNAMISGGFAKPVFQAQDVLVEYGINTPQKAQQTLDITALPLEQALICKLLEAQPRSFDELCEMTAFSPAVLNSNLTVLELSGIIKQSSGRTYQL